MIHVEREAAKLIEEWKSKGFNGIRFIDCYMQPTSWEDFESDGKTREEYEQWIQGYACFVAHPDIYDDFGFRGNPYAKTGVDWGQCFSDMIAAIKQRLGDDIDVQHRSGCHEFECFRKEKTPEPEPATQLKDVPPEYRIETLQDIFDQVPEEKIEDFIIDLHNCLRYLHAVKKLSPTTAARFPYMIWVDDGKHDLMPI